MTILEHFTIDMSDTTTGEATVEANTTEARRAFAVAFGAGAVSVSLPVGNIHGMLNDMFSMIHGWELNQ